MSYTFISTCTGHYRRYERALDEWMEDNDRTEAPTRVKNRILGEVYASGPLRRRLKPNARMCAEKGCKERAVKRGYCNPHYSRRYRDNTLPEVPRTP